MKTIVLISLMLSGCAQLRGTNEELVYRLNEACLKAGQEGQDTRLLYICDDIFNAEERECECKCEDDNGETE